ncbi:F-box domain protein [Paraphaeosphaeria minitans]|uniref:F-box domain protein n=1 Tax=Paraphaeosphaeria minitans TaxID=565426 RepID=A0A9P6GGQ4_9PLEO|nr:F-box domain protein [Paraphaeosphaeria minitans]
MVPFDDLPVELTEAIIVNTPLRDLSSLSKTCKRIRAMALRTMFRRIDFQWNSNNSRGPPVTALLGSILENPDVGKNGMFEKALEECPREEEGKCDDRTAREGNLNAGIGVLISYCTRVESLSIDIELLMHNYRLPAMLRSTLYRYLDPEGIQFWFEKLHQVRITHTDAHHRTPRDHGRNEANYAENLSMPTQTYLSLFYLPNVRNLDMSFFPNVSISEDIQKDTLRHTVWSFPQAPLAFTLTTLRF